MRGFLKTCLTRKALAAFSRLRVTCERNRKGQGIHRAPMETCRTPLENKSWFPVTERWVSSFTESTTGFSAEFSRKLTGT